jgi:hypothetical protein
MNLSRRRFVTTAASTGGALLAIATSGLSQMPEPPLPPVGDGGPLARMNFLTFYGQLNTEFIFLNKDRDEVPLKLVQVEDQRPLAQRKWGQGKENFMLRFLGHPRFPLPQNTYHVSHFTLGKFDLFITGPTVVDDDLSFTAIINRVDGI